MKILFVILFSFFCLLGYSQEEDPVNPSRVKGEGYALRDASGRIIVTESGGVLSIIQVEDTASSQLVLPPDTAQVFNVTLAASDTFSSLRTELRASWSLEDASGDAVDSVNNYNLTPHGTITHGQTGKIGDCFSFLTDGYLDSIPSVFNFSGSFTVSFCMNSTDGDLYSHLVTNAGVPSYGWESYILDTGIGKARVLFRYSGGNVQLSGTSQINDGIWHHFAFSRSIEDDTVKLWIDGDLEDSDVLTSPIIYDAGTGLTVGSRYGTQYFLDGKMDEIMIWNRELTQTEIDSLVAEVQYPFLTEGSGGDSLRQIIEEPDLRADTMRIIFKYIGDGYPTNEDDGTELFAFNMADWEDYKDTTFFWPYLKDTTAIIAACTGLDPEDIWILQYDTVFIDSSDRTPPDQDVGIWDTILDMQDWEHRTAPSYWSLSNFQTDVPLSIGRYGEQWYRSEELRFPQWWSDNVDDSIVIDPVTGSKVLRTMWRGGYHDSYDGTSQRGGEYWKQGFPSGAKYTELYSSINIKMSPGFFANQYCGGKIAPGLPGGGPIVTSRPQEYGEGFWYSISWDFQGINRGSIGFYVYYQDQPNNYPQWFTWDDFQPTGGGISEDDYNSEGKWIWPDDGRWINITVRCVTNTHTGATPNYDGILEGYINGRLVAQVSGLYLITYPDIGNEMYYHQFYQAVGGGNQPPMPRNDITMWSYNDDIIVFTYDESVDVPRGNELSPPGRVLNLPGEHKWE